MSLPDPHIGNLEAIETIGQTYVDRLIAQPFPPEKQRELGAFMIVFDVIHKITEEKGHDPLFRPFTFEVINTATNVIGQEPTSHFVDDFFYENENIPEPVKYNLSTEVSDEEGFEFGFKEGIMVGAGAEVGFDIGFVNAKVEVYAELNFEANQTVTRKRTVIKKVEAEIIVPMGEWVQTIIHATEEDFVAEYTVNMIPSFSLKLIEEPMFVDLFNKWKNDSDLGKYFAHRDLATVCPGIDLKVAQKGTIQGSANIKFITSSKKGKLTDPPAKSD